MNPYIITFKWAAISWFMFLTIIAFAVSYFVSKLLAKVYDVDKKIVEDAAFIILIVGFIGARLSYVLLNLDLFRDNLKYIIRLTHYNLNLLGAIVFGLLALIFIAKKHKIKFYKLYRTFITPFYFSMAIGIWSLFFDGVLIGKAYGGPLSLYYLGKGRHFTVMYLSILFLLAMIAEWIPMKDQLKKIVSYATLPIVILIYYMIKMNFIA